MDIVELFYNKDLLTASNWAAVLFITIHFMCELGHYIYEFVSRRKDTKKLDVNNDLLQNLVNRIEKIEVTISNKKCPLKQED